MFTAQSLELHFVLLSHVATHGGGQFVDLVERFAVVSIGVTLGDGTGDTLIVGSAVGVVVSIAIVVVARVQALTRFDLSGIDVGLTNRQCVSAKKFGHVGSVLNHVGVDIERAEFINLASTLIAPLCHRPGGLRFVVTCVFDNRVDFIEVMLGFVGNALLFALLGQAGSCGGLLSLALQAEDSHQTAEAGLSDGTFE
ncbi:hypothetical protein-transmembrane prediction [Rhodopirellula baltica SH 1]|uniref:Uncharacterized protein n=1 Tax=Rhodopirellula baltica (strain DSM 10527 / NCIMB 13988 / SH1) TaxID=243090 RepID=Q7ULG1_RHOBA|nr:hypothetical protein-transmembrane prediction [Rhodopirellula baltica SH 1]